MLSFWKITFPVFPIPNSYQLQTDGDLTYVEYINEIGVLDDKSTPGDTLARRRLNLKDKGVKLVPLKRPLYTLGDILHSKAKTFIDKTGKVFNYIKSNFVPAECHKISYFYEYYGGYVIVVEGIHCRFAINRAPTLDEHYVQLLRVGMGYVLYDLTHEKLKPTRIKI